MISVRDTMDSFLNVLREKEEGGPFSRFKSWEYCHKKFLEFHQRNLNIMNSNEEAERIIDDLALHLSFYLASWGMYRGSSFLLQRDYKTHKKIVKIVLNSEYNELWDFNPIGKTDLELSAIAELAHRAYQNINDNGYGDIPERLVLEDGGEEDTNAEGNISPTLITKILMGTFAITPAFDRFFIDGLKKYNNAHGTRGSAYSEKRLVSLFKFAQEKYEELNLADGFTSFAYPMMKKVDMYFWEVGYEYGFIEPFDELLQNHLDANGNVVDEKKRRVFKKLDYQVSSVLPIQRGRNDTDREFIERIVSMIHHRVDP